MAKKELILYADEEVSKPFNINGTHQILCKMPPGEDWGDSGDRIVTLEAKSPHPPVVTKYNFNVSASNTNFLEGNSVYTITGETPSIASILTSTGGELKLEMQEDINSDLNINFGSLSGLLTQFDVQNNTGGELLLPGSALRLGQVYKNSERIGTWIEQTNTSRGVQFEGETTTTTTNLGPYEFRFRDQYYMGVDSLNLPSGTLAIAPNSNSDRSRLNFELRTSISGFTIDIIPANNFSFRNNDASNAVSDAITAFPVLLNGVEIADLYTGVRPIILSANGQASLSVNSDDFISYTYTGDLTPADVISLDMRFDGLDSDIDVDLDGSRLRFTLHQDTHTTTIPTDGEFTVANEDLNINRVVTVPGVVSGDEISIQFKMQGYDKDDVSFRFGRSLGIRFDAEVESGEDWFEVEDPIVRDAVIYWDGPGFQEVEGAEDIRYRLRTTNTGCRASLHAIRKWISSKPGR